MHLSCGVFSNWERHVYSVWEEKYAIEFDVTLICPKESLTNDITRKIHSILSQQTWCERRALSNLVHGFVIESHLNRDDDLPLILLLIHTLFHVKTHIPWMGRFFCRIESTHGSACKPMTVHSIRVGRHTDTWLYLPFLFFSVNYCRAIAVELKVQMSLQEVWLQVSRTSTEKPTFSHSVCILKKPVQKLAFFPF